MGNSSSTSSDVQQRRVSSGAAHPPPPANPPPYYQYPGFYPHPAAMPLTMPEANWISGRYPMMPPSQPIEHQKVVTVGTPSHIRRWSLLKKETLRVLPDDEDSGKFLVAFSFDAKVAGSLTLIFFAKEDEDCHIIPTKQSSYEPITMQFQEGLSQKFKQPLGTGIDLSSFQEAELSKDCDTVVYPLAIKLEASCNDDKNRNADSGSSPISQITLAVFEKDREEYQVKVMKQILWVSGMRYELQEIFGIGNSVEDEFDGSDRGKECVVCLSEPRDTLVLPCRHACMCRECAKVVRFQTNRCLICRQPIERLLEIKVSNEATTNQ